MGDTWVTDMQHFLDSLDPLKAGQVPLPAHRLAMHLGSIVEAVTAGWHARSELIPTVVSCRRHPGHKPCPGFIAAALADDKDHIEWGCSNCNDNGAIYGWQGTLWDFSDVVGLGFARGGHMAEFVITPGEHEALRRILILDREAERVVKAARLGPEIDQVIIEAPGAWLDHLMEYVAFEVNDTRSRKTQALLRAILAKAGW